MKIIHSLTASGWPVATFTDFYGHGCSLQQSSLAEVAAIWLGVDNAEPMILASEAPTYGIQTTAKAGWIPYPVPPAVLLTTRMHLTRAQVEALLPVLQRYVETGEITP